MTLDDFNAQRAELACQQCGSTGLETFHNPKRPSSEPTPAEVWEVNGNHCAYCGKTKDECEKYGIGITMQHVHPFADGGEESHETH